MSEISLILLAAGNSTRFGLGTKKQWLRIGDEPLWLFVAKNFEKIAAFKEIIVVGDKNELGYMSFFADYTFVEGGKERQESLSRALELVHTPFVLTADAARCCVDEGCVKRVLDAKGEFDCIAPAIGVSDTATLSCEYVKREDLHLIQTPQLSKTHFLKNALSADILFTDDSSAMKRAGYTVGYVDGSKKQAKLTSKEDLKLLSCLTPPIKDVFCGIGFDTHVFVEEGSCFLGGVKVTDKFGFKAHSDGDVLIHSIIDAVLGAAGLGDIGEFFPDTNQDYKGADSTELLRVAIALTRAVGFEISNIDMTIVAEKPKLFALKADIRKNLSRLLNIPPHRICVKATTAEKMGAIGREEGAMVISVASLKYFDWTVV